MPFLNAAVATHKGQLSQSNKQTNKQTNKNFVNVKHNHGFLIQPNTTTEDLLFIQLQMAKHIHGLRHLAMLLGKKQNIGQNTSNSYHKRTAVYLTHPNIETLRKVFFFFYNCLKYVHFVYSNTTKTVKNPSRLFISTTRL